MLERAEGKYCCMLFVERRRIGVSLVYLGSRQKKIRGWRADKFREG